MRGLSAEQQACFSSNLPFVFCVLNFNNQELISMKHIYSLLFSGMILFLSVSNPTSISAQCAEGESEVLVQILTDNYPGETTWTLSDASGVLLTGGPYNTSATDYSASVCILNTGEPTCLQFVIDDSYGDGICCGYGTGTFTLLIDSVEVATGGDFGYQDIVMFDCAPGTTCNDAVVISDADYSSVINQQLDNFWYTFTPPVNGMYSFNSCGAECNTVLYIYDYCNMNNFDNTNEGSIYYDDFEGGCGEEAAITALLVGGEQVWVRFASLDESCGGFDWSFEFVGPPTGCMDSSACNYNPAAEIDNGTCIYEGDPMCTGPDLEIVTDAITSSLYATTMQVEETDCYIDEGCLNGFGERQIIRFTTHIKNIGALDYYIGTTTNNDETQQFEWGECHNHWHYDGYAKYDLFDMDGGFIPVGFKNGFCVMDLECSGGGSAQYGCSNMGITAGCGDIYSSGLSCQWIDVTDVPDGQYRLVVRVNWDYAPDALGRYEMNTENNWGVVCIEIDRSVGYEVAILTDCPVFTDCSGEAYGTTLVDCVGECGGATLMGDIDGDFDQDVTDAELFSEGVLGGDIPFTTCNDINSDGLINVVDAATIADCQYWNAAHAHPDSSGVHNHCDFPTVAVLNPFDNVEFSIGDVNWEEQYFDVHVLNPDNRIYAYQLEFDGVQISQTTNLIDPEDYSANPSHVPGGIDVISLSYDGSSIPKNIVHTPLLRVHWIGSANGMVCISQVTDVVNTSLQTTMTSLFSACVEEFNSACLGDVDGDLVVSVSDILEVLGEFGCVSNCSNDVNGDGYVNVADVLLVLSSFGTVC